MPPLTLGPNMYRYIYIYIKKQCANIHSRFFAVLIFIFEKHKYFANTHIIAYKHLEIHPEYHPSTNRSRFFSKYKWHILCFRLSITCRKGCPARKVLSALVSARADGAMPFSCYKLEGQKFKSTCSVALVAVARRGVHRMRQRNRSVVILDL